MKNPYLPDSGKCFRRVGFFVCSKIKKWRLKTAGAEKVCLNSFAI